MRTNYTPAFNKFWTAYPKKDAKLRAVAWFAKNKPTDEDVEKMLYTIAFQSKQSGGRLNCERAYQPLPCTWLNDGDWMDAPSKEELEQQREEKEKREATVKAQQEAAGRARAKAVAESFEVRRDEIRESDGPKYKELPTDRLQALLKDHSQSLWITRGWLIEEIISERSEN